MPNQKRLISQKPLRTPYQKQSSQKPFCPPYTKQPVISRINSLSTPTSQSWSNFFHTNHNSMISQNPFHLFVKNNLASQNPFRLFVENKFDISESISYFCQKQSDISQSISYFCQKQSDISETISSSLPNTSWDLRKCSIFLSQNNPAYFNPPPLYRRKA